MNPGDTTGTESIDELIEKSSLGTPGAQQLRRRTPREQVAATVRAAEEPASHPRDIPASWIDAALQGDRAAVEKILNVIQPIIRRYCQARLSGTTGLQNSVDDVVQEVCITALTTLPVYRNIGRPFLAHVYGIASHKVQDLLRRIEDNQLNFVATVPVEHADSPDDTSEDPHAATLASLRKDVAELLALLPAQSREILILRVVVGLTPEQTAQVIGSTPGAVRVAQARALFRLRQEHPEALAALTEDALHGHG